MEQRDSFAQDCLCSSAAWLQDTTKWSKGKCNNFVHQLWTHQMYRASVRCTAACGFAMCTKNKNFTLSRKKKNKNMLHVDCGAACHVCQEH